MDLTRKEYMEQEECLAVMTANTPKNLPAMVMNPHPTMVQVAIMAKTVLMARVAILVKIAIMVLVAIMVKTAIMVLVAMIANRILHLNMAQES